MLHKRLGFHLNVIESWIGNPWSDHEFHNSQPKSYSMKTELLKISVTHTIVDLSAMLEKSICISFWSRIENPKPEAPKWRR